MKFIANTSDLSKYLEAPISKNRIITNISMAIGVLPVVGVTLPLLSLGGSSLLSIFIAFGIIFSVNRRN